MSGNTVPHNRLLAAHAEAQRFYRQQLLTSPVAQGPCHYLAQRGLAHVLAPDSIWQVGYAPARWTDLRDHLSRLGFREEELLGAGLVCRSRRGGVVDRFRDRIMLPQRNDSGHVVGFIGRAAPGAPVDVPKYLNSPQTPIYHKGESLFGLHEERQALADGCRPVLVEGPLDVLAIAATNTRGHDPLPAVAPCGTALTREHVQLLAGHADDGVGVVVAYDNDTAGRRAAAMAYELLRDQQQLPSSRLFAAELPRGADPADLLQIHGSPAVRSALTDARHLRSLAERAIDARLEDWTAVLDGIDGRVAAVKALARLVAGPPESDIASHVVHLAKRVHLDPETVTIAITETLTEDFFQATYSPRQPRAHRAAGTSPSLATEGPGTTRSALSF